MMLMLSGEGTWHQLMRMTESMKAVAGDPPGGRGKLKCEVVNSIKAIWISHPHADHHLGLVCFTFSPTSLIVYMISWRCQDTGVVWAEKADSSTTGSYRKTRTNFIDCPLFGFGICKGIWTEFGLCLDSTYAFASQDYCEIDPFLNGSYIPLQSRCCWRAELSASNLFCVTCWLTLQLLRSQW